MMLLKYKWDHVTSLYSTLVEWLPVSSGVKAKFPTNSPGGPKRPAISRPAWPHLLLLSSCTLSSHTGLFFKHGKHRCRAFALAVPSAWDIFPPDTYITGFATSSGSVHSHLLSRLPLENFTFSLMARMLLPCFIFLLFNTMSFIYL